MDLDAAQFQSQTFVHKRKFEVPRGRAWENTEKAVLSWENIVQKKPKKAILTLARKLVPTFFAGEADHSFPVGVLLCNGPGSGRPLPWLRILDYLLEKRKHFYQSGKIIIQKSSSTYLKLENRTSKPFGHSFVYSVGEESVQLSGFPEMWNSCFCPQQPVELCCSKGPCKCIPALQVSVAMLLSPFHFVNPLILSCFKEFVFHLPKCIWSCFGHLIWISIPFLALCNQSSLGAFCNISTPVFLVGLTCPHILHQTFYECFCLQKGTF